ncbi:MAG TPA: hypothetical protein VIL30_05190 [Ramlibacter sp.]|jgi:TPR repeat protein
MGSMKAPRRALAALLLAGGCSLAGAQAPSEVTARNAAAGHVLSSLATLAMLRDECEPLLPGADGALATAQGWWERNRADIEVAYVWTDRYLQAVRSTDATHYQELARSVGTHTNEVVRRNAAAFFGGQLPTADTCRAALQRFTAAAGTDDPFAEAVRTLARVRQEPGYAVPAHVTLDPARSLRFGLSASLLAAQAAVERRDADGVRKAYAWMTRRGDARAAYQLATMHTRGEVVKKDDQEAYLWFHKAWMLREPEGANALGVMHRDGRWVAANSRLALALFQLATVQAREPAAKARAERNLRQLAAKMSPEDRQATACMTLKDLADGVERPLPLAERASATIFDPEQGRRLGDFMPQVSGGVPFFCG